MVPGQVWEYSDPFKILDTAIVYVLRNSQTLTTFYECVDLLKGHFTMVSIETLRHGRRVA